MLGMQTCTTYVGERERPYRGRQDSALAMGKDYLIASLPSHGLLHQMHDLDNWALNTVFRLENIDALQGSAVRLGRRVFSCLFLGPRGQKSRNYSICIF